MKKTEASIWEHFPTDCDTLIIERDGSLIKPMADGSPVRSPLYVKLQPQFARAAESLAARFRNIIVIVSTSEKHPLDCSEQEAVNAAVKEQVEAAGGRIDGFYCARTIGAVTPLSARRDFPDINFERTILVGDDSSDRRLAYNCGMRFISSDPLLEADEIVDFEHIEQEFAIFRSCIAQYMETLSKMMNSAPRLRGLRLASRCVCHAIARGKKINVVTSLDSGINGDELVNDLNKIVPDQTQTRHMLVIPERREGPSIAERVAEIIKPGDVTIFITIGNNPDINRAFEDCRHLDSATVSITGGKPSPLDETDVVIKIPSTSFAHTQGLIRLVAAMLHILVSHAEHTNRMF